VARGLLPSGGGIRCEQMSLAGSDVYYFHRSSWWHHLVSARLAVFAHCGRLCVLLGSVEPSHTGMPLAGETNGRQPVVAGNISGAGAAGSRKRGALNRRPAAGLGVPVEDHCVQHL
jgi:hypothetical protein